MDVVFGTHRLGDPYGEAKICRVLGKSLVRQGRDAEAEDFLGRAVVLFHELGEQAEESDSLLGRVTQSWRQDRVAEAYADARQALMLAEAASSANLRATALSAIGRCALALGAPQETISCCTAALALYRAIGNDEGRAYALRVLGSVYHHLGQWDAAVATYEESLALDVALRDDYFAALALDQIGLVHQAAGRVAEATSAWRRSLALLECLGNPEADGVRARLNAIS
ncbi:tetratricopeptide repeat protein [Actinocrispum wychmicini]|uniref:Tetratricopeptide repeat protein n=1 Tax=Actinocrispum wychmicini TaxID=1213861 RepID=A0A4R2JS29_9PSEU|nr:tetratricopeptide repeat protein [Actinocrispum wychmicini]TCO61887.1 tetratricopeptide repeat protein [Actinocrispum wychmicini]